MSDTPSEGGYVLPAYINGSNVIIASNGGYCFIKSLRGFWELPGGGVELRERELADEAAERETDEEGNMNANRQHYSIAGIFVQTIPKTKDAEGRSIYGQLTLFYTSQVDCSEMKAGPEATDVKFLTEAEIYAAFKKHEFAPFSAYLRLLGHYLNWIRSENRPNFISARLSDRVTFELDGKTITV